VLFSGVFSDFLLRRGFSLGVARKGPIITGLLLTTAMLGANFTDSTALVIVFLSIAFFGNGLASITWSLVSALAPTRLIGLTGGMFNFIGNLSSIATPIIIGLIVTDAELRARFLLHDGDHHPGHRVLRAAGGPCRTGPRPRRRHCGRPMTHT
jgi:MFS transporter, ACS family, D-galactonate transporter